MDWGEGAPAGQAGSCPSPEGSTASCSSLLATRWSFCEATLGSISVGLFPAAPTFPSPILCTLTNPLYCLRTFLSSWRSFSPLPPASPGQLRICSRYRLMGRFTPRPSRRSLGLPLASQSTYYRSKFRSVLCMFSFLLDGDFLQDRMTSDLFLDLQRLTDVGDILS